MKKSVKSKTPSEEYTKLQIEELVLSGIADLLSRPGKDHSRRDWTKNPLSHDEQLWLIETLHKELADPDIPGGLIFMYGKILDFVAEKILYN